MEPLDIVTLIFGVLAAVMFTVAGVSKLTGQSAMRESALHFRIPWPRYRAIGLLEILIVAGIVVGFWFPPIGIAAGAVGAALMVGALIFHVRAQDTRKAMNPAIAVLIFSAAYTVAQLFQL